MTHNPKPTVPQDQSVQQFLAIYEKMLSDSHSLARQMAVPIEREGAKPKNAGRPS